MLTFTLNAFSCFLDEYYFRMLPKEHLIQIMSLLFRNSRGLESYDVIKVWFIG